MQSPSHARAAGDAGFSPSPQTPVRGDAAAGELPAALTALLHQTDRSGKQQPATPSPASSTAAAGAAGSGSWGSRYSAAPSPAAGAGAEAPTPVPTLAIGADGVAIPAHRGVLMAPTPVLPRTSAAAIGRRVALANAHHTVAADGLGGAVAPGGEGAAAADGGAAPALASPPPPAALQLPQQPARRVAATAPAPALAPPGFFQRMFCCAGGPVPSEPERGGGAPAPAPLRPHASEKERLRLAAEALRAPGDDAAAASATSRNSWLVQTQAQNAAWQREQAAQRAGGGAGGKRATRVIWRRPLAPTERVNNVVRPASLYGEGPLLGPLFDCDRGRKCLVLDLDETLVHSSFRPVPNPHYILPVEIEGIIHSVYVIKRPGCDEFLQRMGRCYEVVVFTASLAKYANPLLDLLDTHNVIRARLFREACVQHEGSFVKDMSMIGRNPTDTIIVDNSPASYLFQPENALPCESFIDDPQDRELYALADMLETIQSVVDVREALQRWTSGTYNGLANLAVLPQYEGEMLEEEEEINSREPSPVTISAAANSSEVGFAVAAGAGAGAAGGEPQVRRAASNELRTVTLAGEGEAGADTPVVRNAMRATAAAAAPDELPPPPPPPPSSSAAAASALRLAVSVDGSAAEPGDAGAADAAPRSPTAARAEADRKQPLPAPLPP